ncbi:unnamed protein product [Nippostrongylus brasiliensis]|uniref:Nucleoporin_N domain-containing protein n=1 Tax=Nippostrongylus brasiliensis TaxID=27835 RepID=A0A0N4XFV7_NIPBR|nr:unnamed protein product [Nippostrongylus brasiliensis]
MEGMVTIIERASDWREETVSLLRCDGKRELWRNRENLPTAEVIAVPSAITLLKHSTESKVFEVVIHRMGIFLRPPIKLISSDNTQPVFIIASDPDIDQINTYTQYRSSFLVMVRIPIYFVDSYAKFNVKICVQDSYEPRAPTQETAILSVSNTALGVDIVKSNVPLNRDYVTFLLSEGYYQITAKAANHRTLSEVVHITAANKSFCLNMEAIDPRALLTTGEGRVVMTKVKATNTVRTPYVSLEPVSANRSHSRVLATVTGTTGGLVSFAPFSNRFLAMELERTVDAGTNLLPHVVRLGKEFLTIRCISSLESECPILHQRRKRTDQHSHGVMNEDGLMVARDRQKRAGELDHPLSSLGLQSIRMASLYSEFIEKLQAIFPPTMTNHLRREEVDRFLRSIADNSELGLGISTVEAETIQCRLSTDMNTQTETTR